MTLIGYGMTKKSLPHYDVPNSLGYSSLWCEVTSWSWQRFWKKLWNEWKFLPPLCPLRRVNMIPCPNFLGMHDSSVFSCFPSSTDIPLLYPRHSSYRGPLVDPKSDHSVSKVVQPFFLKGFKVLWKVHILNHFKILRPQTWNLLLFPPLPWCVSCMLTQEFFMNISSMSWPWDTRSLKRSNFSRVVPSYLWCSRYSSSRCYRSKYSRREP